MSELKACPFCGGKVGVYKMIGLLGHEHPGFVRCDCVDGVSVARWNDRPIEDALRTDLARLTVELATVEEKKETVFEVMSNTIARRDDIIKRLVEDAAHLYDSLYARICYSRDLRGYQQLIDSHRALMKELNNQSENKQEN